ncbi:cupredoxin domain-containing protein [Arthrobacter sp. ISL-95]|uniref:cupredoxin domain-containing protein n=1 Tax=Arthrobacter sp. ISL-95 TaxID=2819116 RepID=UPI001BE8993C|nr:cupredoxin domain-containing protein [Arthrobacter sp. ISL-95]MBT2585609.1 cupredoxin domain-containing protein [Arthrobacter sp. ISL-95]
MKKTTKTVSTLALTAAAAVTLILSGCGNNGMSGSDATAAPTLTKEFPSAPAATLEATPSPSSEDPSTAAAAEILIKGFKYQDTQLINPGTTITVTNEDIEAHSLTADTPGAFDLTIKPGTATFTAPTTPGTYPYHCIFHANMKGTLTVK